MAKFDHVDHLDALEIHVLKMIQYSVNQAANLMPTVHQDKFKTLLGHHA